MLRIRPLWVVGIGLALILCAGCQVTARRVSMWIYPAVTYPSRSVEVGDGKQIFVPEYAPRGDITKIDFFCVGVRLVPIHAENKNSFSTSNPLEWLDKIQAMSKSKATP